MIKYQCNLIILFTVVVFYIPILALADNRQTVNQMPVSYLQWQRNNDFTLSQPIPLTAESSATNWRLQDYLDQLPITVNYQGFIRLPQQSSTIDNSYIMIMGGDYHLLNLLPELNSIPLVVEQKIDNSALQASIDNLSISDSYQGVIHLPQQNSVNGNSYLVIQEESNYYLINILANSPLPTLRIEQKTDNTYLKQYIENLPSPTFYQGFAHLPKGNRIFDSYIILDGSNHHLVNILADGTLFSHPNIAKHWSQGRREKDNHWTIYTIDESLNLKVTEAIIHYSQLQKKFLITRKINEQRYRVNDVGDVIMLSDKQFPNVITKYDPTNFDSCTDSPLGIGIDIKSSYPIVPLPIDRRYNFHPNIKTIHHAQWEATHHTRQCQNNHMDNIIKLPNVYQYNVIRFDGENAQYLATINKKGQPVDMMVIYYAGDGKQRKISYTINRDYSIDLTMTEPDGKVVKQTFSINQQGEFE